MLIAATDLTVVWFALVGVLVGGLLTWVGTYLSHWLTEKRERRSRRDQLRLELYLEVIDLVLENELAIAERGAEGNIPPVELQTNRLRISHRLKLIGSRRVAAGYASYRRAAHDEAHQSIADRALVRIDDVPSRETLIEMMRNDIQGDPSACQRLKGWLDDIRGKSEDGKTI